MEEWTEMSSGVDYILAELSAFDITYKSSFHKVKRHMSKKETPLRSRTIQEAIVYKQYPANPKITRSIIDQWGKGFPPLPSGTQTHRTRGLAR